MGGLRAPFLLVSFTLVLLSSIFFARPLNAAEDGTDKGLKLGFYDNSCPHAERIVHETIKKHSRLNPDLPAGLIRLFFHDCFVTGCDASLLLDSNIRGGTVEKLSPANRNTLRGLEVIDEAKAILEAQCPATVSCADIVAFAARESTALAGLRPYAVPAGRRDGSSSNAIDTLGLPSPGLNASAMIDLFAKRGFSASETVVLLGAHSIGSAHCKFFKNSLYKFNGTQAQDPSLEPAYAEMLKHRCPRIDSVNSNLDSVSKVPFESVTNRKLDVEYYKELEKGRGLLGADRALMTDERTLPMVREMAEDQKRWAESFTKALLKVGALDVLVGDKGEIRRECRFVNRN